jgi:hypothetical protein
MDSKLLVETALRVLVAWNGGAEPANADVEILKGAFPSSAHLPIDDLACQVIHDLSSVVFREPDRERKPPGSTTHPQRRTG